ncbi:MAG: beta-N-acetylhexosaminidase [Aromatoleum sp.]|uniref:beta-N-acetylhexosaminidase n=1 Tax=Aromatoleum sp. TaxID=2307007 RepID=UPI0028950CE7|nr:beta-N-acetylhexosaminidase [Aromatoleum sp.]MDT3669020.1 beta-N-acetylhexosaminidase [Aromatoleum sp.]
MTNETPASPARNLPLGPVMLDVAGFALTDEERERLRHPLVGGVILFARNFRNSLQLAALTAEIHAVRERPLIIAVDHEGGRVQRFRNDGFTHIPSMRSLGRLWEQDHVVALESSRSAGYVLAAELLAHGVDLSFTPVLDLDYGCSRVVGDRAFHRDPQVVGALAQSLVSGMTEAGMGCVGKHFPGHGFAEADSHVEIPVDERDFNAIWADDIAPYRDRLGSRLSGVMPAHVIYRRVDANPAGFSSFWLQDVLRTRVGFQGVIFSDDLTMEGAAVAGDILARASAAYTAGCDMVLVCNRPDLAADLLDRWNPQIGAESRARIEALRSRPRCADVATLEQHPIYQQARAVVSGIVERAA